MSRPPAPAARYNVAVQDLASALTACGCEVRGDALTRRLYASDASLYQVEPRAVAFPRTTAQTAAVVAAAAAAGVAVTPRGAGTGLAGGALGDGLVVDLARWGRWVDPVDRATATVRVGPGVVLDQLNAALRSPGLCFGPDVATSSRATIGGMVANNSSGAHAPVYGTTADHLAQLEVVLADGTVAVVGPGTSDLAELAAAAERVAAGAAGEVARRLPPGLVKRWPGYGLDRYLRAGGDLSQLVAGSEGTLALVTAATLRLVPLPVDRGLAVLFFATVAEALAAAVEIAALGPAAVELMDHQVLEPTRANPRFRAARELLGLDREPGAAVLVVEVLSDVDDYLSALATRGHGRRTLLCRDRREQELVWSVRKAGLNLLTARLGSAKPAACIEDVCVRPEQLPAYVAELARIMAELGLEAAYYGHAASGELHIRPVLDLTGAGGVRDLRRVSDAVSALCVRFAGSFAAEHGVGMARTEYLAAHLGPELTAASGELKRLFDPAAVLNPGKIVDTGRYRIDRDLRQAAGQPLVLPFVPRLSVGDRHESFVANLEQCNGCGACRKDTPGMCPTFIATGDEAESTRGRANAIRAALAGGLGPDPVLAAELAAVLDDCLACKACRAECPSGIDLAAMKSQLLAARHARRGSSLFDRLVAAADLLGRLGTMAPGPANRALAWPPLRRALERWLGVAAERPLPTYAEQRFDHWFAARPAPPPGERPRVLLWDDTWVRYHEPTVGVAAVAALEALGLTVELVAGRRCCGRPAV